MCGFRGALVAIVHRHVSVVHADQRCHLCDFSTTERPALLHHLKYWHERRCDKCDYRFRKGEDMGGHVCVPEVLQGGNRGQGGGGGLNSELEKVSKCQY